MRHDHDPWGSCRGTVEVDEKGIRFQSEEKEHSRDWSWNDIQSVDRYSPRRFSVLTYHDQKWLLGQDRAFDFTVPEGESGFTEALFEEVRSNLPGPLVDRQVRALETEYEVPVKHLHTFGGCEGELLFGRDLVVFHSEDPDHSRSWRRDREVQTVWSSGPYDLELDVYERQAGDLQRTRRFRFQLKEPINRSFYTRLKREMIPHFQG